ncbi:MAG: RNA-binding protein, partial [Thermoproteota archaeon]
MQDDKKRYVIPGDVITTGPYRPDQNVTLDGNRIIATVIGISEISDDGVRVIPLTGMY